ncbi:hypothetical protein DFH28DRAFT_195716 [Melampsora americana]|nr:hypothetical protein DFH28DRAFT_195716 [Melampsora americana]
MFGYGPDQGESSSLSSSSSSKSSNEGDHESSSTSEKGLDEEVEEWEVDYIEDTRIVGDHEREFLIKYKGYEEPEWHGENALENSGLLVDAFWRSVRKSGSTRADWIAEQLKALEEEEEEEEENEVEEAEAEEEEEEGERVLLKGSGSKIQEGLILKELPIQKKKKKKKKKKIKEDEEDERINSDLASSSSSSSTSSSSSSSSIFTLEETDEDPKEREFYSKFFTDCLEIQQLIESTKEGIKKIKLEKKKFSSIGEQILQHASQNEEFDHEDCVRKIPKRSNLNPLQGSIDHSSIENSNLNHLQIHQIETNQRKDNGKGKGRLNENQNQNGNQNQNQNQNERKRKRHKEKEKGKGKGKGKGKEDELNSNQNPKENQNLKRISEEEAAVEEESEEEEEEESEDELEVKNKRMKKIITKVNSNKKFLRVCFRT